MQPANPAGRASSETSTDPAKPPARAPATLIVGVDGRPHDEDALALARVLAEGLGGHLICAFAMGNVVGGRGMAEYEASIEREARELIRRTADRLGAEPELLRGENHADALARLATRRAATVVVLGSTHRGELGRIVPGGVASRLLTHAPCAIAVAPAGYASRPQGPIGLVGVAYDGTRESVRAAEEATKFARSVHASVRLYHAFHQVPEGPSWDVFRANMRQFAQGIVDGGVERLPDDVSPDGRALEGPPADAIAREAQADGVDILFAGSRGYGPLREALVGGMGGSLLISSTCPLVILPRSSVGSDEA